MAIEVDLSNPPPWVVEVIFMKKGGKVDMPVPVTWPFPTEGAARIAYALAVGSGQFTYCYKKATKKEPAVFIHLVSLWHVVFGEDIHGNPATWYRGVHVPDEELSESTK